MQIIWSGLFQRHGGPLAYEFDISTLAHISAGYTSGALDAVVHSLLTRRRLERVKEAPVDIPEVLQWLCKVRLNQCMYCCNYSAIQLFSDKYDRFHELCEGV